MRETLTRPKKPSVAASASSFVGRVSAYSVSTAQPRHCLGACFSILHSAAFIIMAIFGLWVRPSMSPSSILVLDRLSRLSIKLAVSFISANLLVQWTSRDALSKR